MKRVHITWTETSENTYVFVVDDDFDSNDQDAVEALVAGLEEEPAIGNVNVSIDRVREAR